VPVAELVFELYGLALALHHDTRLLKTPDSLSRARRVFQRILAANAVSDRLATVQENERSKKSPSPLPHP
ncbi:MAG: TetR/AcrR family transcriptional regulator, partial [Burkholderiales bacterium]|nr:TetR/AcrR family transcriptional regulator [Burkholderiales bacterium]